MDNKAQPYKCKFCQRGFTRSDTRRLHYDKCKARIAAGVSIPPPARKGRKLRACDVCAQRKRACNYETPCAYCKAKNIRCHYSRAGQVTDVTQAQTSSAMEPDNATLLDVKDAGHHMPDGMSGAFLGDETADVSFSHCSNTTTSGIISSDWATERDALTDGTLVYRLDRVARNHGQLVPAMPLTRTLRPTIIRPQTAPLHFLSHFASAKGMADMFNFSFYRSRHKSRGRLTSFHHTTSIGPNVFPQTNAALAVGRQYLLPEVAAPLQDHSSSISVPTAANSSWPPMTAASIGSMSSSSPPDLGAQAEGSSWSIDDMSSFPTFEEPFDNPAFDEFLCWLADPLFLRTREIWLHMQQEVAKSPDNYSMPMSANQSQRCLQFFNPANLQRFTDSFFDDWYPHGPIVHRPTFSLHTAPMNLILVMCLIGAALSPSPEDLEMAKEWFDYAENLIFHHESGLQQNVEFLRLGLCKPSILQAAFLMCCLQNWEGTDEARTRIRRHKYKILIDASRRIGSEKATHNGGINWGSNNFDWLQWAAVEELIRTQLFIWLVDTSFVIFHNSTAKIQTSELNYDLLSPASCFQAPTASHCQSELLRLCPPGTLRTRLLFSSAVNILRTNTFDEATCNTFLALDSVNLFALLAAIYVMPFQQDYNVFHICGLDSGIRAALDTWQLAWNARSDIVFIENLESSPVIEPWTRIGFFQHADEYRQYSLGVLRKLEGKLGGGEAQRRADTGVVMALEQYDETSMDQVARLLKDLQVHGLGEGDERPTVMI